MLRLHPNRQLYLKQLPLKKVSTLILGISDFHGVTGGVYKARERIQRNVADLRLLAIPTSCSRVSDYNPD